MLYQEPAIEIVEIGTRDVITGSITNTGDIVTDVTWQ